VRDPNRPHTPTPSVMPDISDTEGPLLNVSTHPPSKVELVRALKQLMERRQDQLASRLRHLKSILPPLQMRNFTSTSREDLGSRKSSNKVEAWSAGEAAQKGGPMTR